MRSAQLKTRLQAGAIGLLWMTPALTVASLALSLVFSVDPAARGLLQRLASTSDRVSPPKVERTAVHGATPSLMPAHEPAPVAVRGPKQTIGRP